MRTVDIAQVLCVMDWFVADYERISRVMQKLRQRDRAITSTANDG